MVILDCLAYLNVIEKFEYMQHDVQEMLMLKESGTDKELISLLTKKNKTLEDSNEKLQQQLAQANEKYENLKQNMDPHATVSSHKAASPLILNCIFSNFVVIGSV